MHAKFDIVGNVVSAVVKESKRKPGNFYGQLTVATGTAAQEFFVEVRDVQAGKYPEGAEVAVTGMIGRNGFNPDLRAESIIVAEAPSQKAAGKPVAA